VLRYTPLGLNRSPAIDFSGMMGTPSIVIGAQISFSTRMGKFTKYKGWSVLDKSQVPMLK